MMRYALAAVAAAAITLGGAAVFESNEVRGTAVIDPQITTGLTVEQRISAGDDNADGEIMEDETGWSCHLMGNRVCGPVR